MAVVHMRRSANRGTEFPTECGAVGDKLLIADSWDKVTCNNCIRKFGPQAAKDTYKEQAKDRGVKTPDVIREEKSVDKARMDLEGLLNGIRSQQLRLEGIKISVSAFLTPVGAIDVDGIIEIMHCVEYLEAALENLRVVKGMVFSEINGTSVNGEEGGSV